MELPLAAAGTRVLLIGTSSYESEDLPDVSSIDATLTDLADVFVRNCGVLPQNLVTLRDPGSVSEVGDALVQASESATGALVVYYVGHGLVHSDGDLYLAHGRTVANSSRLAFTALRYQSLRGCILNSLANPLYVILDCCFAGRAVGTLASTSVADLARVDGACVIAAAPRDALALAPVGDVHTAFTGALIEFLRAGDVALGQHLRVRDAVHHLSRVLPSRNFPGPVFTASQNSDELVLCRNPAFSTGEDRLSGIAPTYDRTSFERRDQPIVPPGVVIGEIIDYVGRIDFNPLPAALTDVDSRVPRNLDQLAELLADRPPSWEARLFAGTALQELVVLRRAFVKHFGGPFTFDNTEKSGQVAFDYIRDEVDNFAVAIRFLDQQLRDDRHSDVLASADPRQIQDHARALTDSIDGFMQFSERLRSVSITNRHLRRAANVLAHFSDQPIIAATQFVHKYIAELDESGQRAAAGEDVTISLTLRLDIPEVLSQQFSDAMAKY